jgi:hypothetical protein
MKISPKCPLKTINLKAYRLIIKQKMMTMLLEDAESPKGWLRWVAGQ